jgi:2-amino-4-hydroxy-6-hydroxymethyldihydropteridine diphosphokinase
MTQVVLLIGSNIEKERNMPAAVRLLATVMTVLATSSVYESVPVGTLAQPAFWNAAVLVEWAADAVTLKEQLSGIEQQLGRVRVADPNAPRTIDLDITLFGDQVFEYAGRQIPDPDLVVYAHIAVPSAEIIPTWRHPVTHETIATIAENLQNMQPDALRKQGTLQW